jgi:hypothetical protein
VSSETQRRAKQEAGKARGRQKREQAQAQRQEAHDQRMALRRAATLPDVAGIVARLQARPTGEPLPSYAERVTSQRGEDGITVELFRRIGLVHHRAVEIGCGANGGNAGLLVAGLGCSALLLDSDAELLEICRAFLAGYPARTEQAWITREGVNQLLAAHGFDRDLDYLGIDLDGVDYWVWEALAVRPRLLISEYNPLFGPEATVSVPYTPDFSRKARAAGGEKRHPKGYYGASLAALEHLAAGKGYRLVVTSPGSPNAYFLRADVAPELPAVRAADAWEIHTKPHAEKRERLTLLYEQIQATGVHRYFAEQGCPLVDVRG